MKQLILPLILSTLLAAPARVGADSPDIDDIPLETVSGNISLKNLQGKVVYLDVWASWCGPCRKSFPWMNEMQRKYSEAGLVILAVNVDAKRTEAARFLEKIPADFTVAYDPEGKLVSAIGAKVMPSSYIIEPDGSIANRHIGFMEKAMPEYELSIRTALGLAHSRPD
jgi:thiol-disulfide isomerase/thioredoxin